MIGNGRQVVQNVCTQEHCASEVQRNFKRLCRMESFLDSFPQNDEKNSRAPRVREPSASEVQRNFKRLRRMESFLDSFKKELIDES